MTKEKRLTSNFSPADLANKLKGKLDALMMKSPKLANALTKATDFTHGLMADLMSDAMFSAAIDMLSKYVDSNILLSAMMVDHDKGDFVEEVAKQIAKDISDLFQVGRNGIDEPF
ncbi:hypothetical protein [Paenibacillus sp. DCT19]|uniref:hypothetical protein n=1 Tax=Paenibacillus sp. DCT19 TaxID=2211212 RepID=UPI000FE1AFB4|nr:hypothetical protein [Paenibacillus sp. DCT19]